MSTRAPGRPCRACESARRAEIDAALLANGSCEAVAKRFGLSPRGTLRHKAGHLVTQIEAAREARRARIGAPGAPISEPPTGAPPSAPAPSAKPGLEDRLRVARGAILEVLRDARTAGDPRLVLAAVDRLLALEGLEARLLGQRDAAVVADQATSAEASEVIGRVLEALAEHPEARIAAAAALLDQAGA